MKNLIKKFCLTIVLLFVVSLQGFAVDYSKSENWVINSADKVATDYDVFYVYPTLFKTDKETLFDWNKPENFLKAKKFSELQTSVFDKKKVRVFAPFVRQIDLNSALSVITELRKGNFDYKASAGRYGIEDTIDALNYYLKNYNNGRPFILFGHSQGAVDLLYALKEVDVGDNFLVAYLIGCPNSTYETLTFNNVKPASSKDDLGVIVVWNTQSEGAENKFFATKNGYVINPLNWKTTDKKVNRFLNRTSRFYNLSTKKFETKHFVSGAKIDKQNGVLLVDLKPNSSYDNYGLMGKGVFHTSDVWLFYGSMRKNANSRYKKYKHLKR